MLIVCLNFARTHNTVSHAEIAQSTELFQHVKQCVLATLKRDELVFWSPRLLFLNSTLFHLDSTIWLDSRLNYTMSHTRAQKRLTIDTNLISKVNDLIFYAQTLHWCTLCPEKTHQLSSGIAQIYNDRF